MTIPTGSIPRGGDFRRDVRIPEFLLEQLTCGELTAPMLLAMTYLYKWSDWRTGRVAYASAGGLETTTRGAHPLRTFQRALTRLEDMGWITREIKSASHNDYAVVINNYKALDDNGEVTILNPKPIIVARKRRGRPPKNKGTYADPTRKHGAEAAQAVGAA